LKRILIPISFSFSIRYILRTGLLSELQKFCTPVILITWHQTDLIEELQNLGLEVHLLGVKKSSEKYLNIRRKIDYWFTHFALKSPSQKIQKNFLSQYNQLAQKRILKWSEIFTVAKFYFSGYKKSIFKNESYYLNQESYYLEIKKWLQNLNCNAVFTVTPFHSQEDILLRACKNIGMKMMTAILSFDNITKRGWIPVDYDVYMVWNKYNQEELYRIYPFTKNKKVVVTGAPQFDFYKNQKFLYEYNEWQNIVGLNGIDHRKIILYAGGPGNLFPNEPQYLKHIDDAITNGQIKNNPIVLFRCHPVDKVQRWKDFIGNSPNIFFDTSWTGSQNLVNANISNEDIAKLCSTLAFTDVHINLCSTMTVDGSAFGKPQIGPAYDDVTPNTAHLLKKMYWQEHFLPVIKVNGIALANNKNELIALINEALLNPTQMSKAANRVVEEIITFSDGKCTQRVIEVIHDNL
jgi:hypothetical protein